MKNNGQITVNFKINVQTNGVHDGLLLATGIQTNNNFETIPCWKTMPTSLNNNNLIQENLEKINIKEMPAIMPSCSNQQQNFKAKKNTEKLYKTQLDTNKMISLSDKLISKQIFFLVLKKIKY